MSREDFLSKLKEKLNILSEEERISAIKYYEEYFNDAGKENEQSVIAELGSVEKVANIILKENNYEINEEKTSENDSDDEYSINRIDFGMLALIIVLLLFGFPIIFPILIAIFFTIFGLFFAGFGMSVGGIVLFIASIVTLFASPFTGLLLMGISLMLFSVGTLFSTIMWKLEIKYVISCIRLFIRIFKLAFNKGGK